MGSLESEFGSFSCVQVAFGAAFTDHFSTMAVDKSFDFTLILRGSRPFHGSATPYMSPPIFPYFSKVTDVSGTLSRGSSFTAYSYS